MSNNTCKVLLTYALLSSLNINSFASSINLPELPGAQATSKGPKDKPNHPNKPINDSKTNEVSESEHSINPTEENKQTIKIELPEPSFENKSEAIDHNQDKILELLDNTQNDSEDKVIENSTLENISSHKVPEIVLPEIKSHQINSDNNKIVDENQSQRENKGLFDKASDYFHSIVNQVKFFINGKLGSSENNNDLPSKPSETNNDIESDKTINNKDEVTSQLPIDIELPTISSTKILNADTISNNETETSLSNDIKSENLKLDDKDEFKKVQVNSDTTKETIEETKTTKLTQELSKINNSAIPSNNTNDNNDLLQANKNKNISINVKDDNKLSTEELSDIIAKLHTENEGKDKLPKQTLSEDNKPNNITQNLEIKGKDHFANSNNELNNKTETEQTLIKSNEPIITQNSSNKDTVFSSSSKLTSELPAKKSETIQSDKIKDEKILVSETLALNEPVSNIINNTNNSKNEEIIKKESPEKNQLENIKAVVPEIPSTTEEESSLEVNSAAQKTDILLKADSIKLDDKKLDVSKKDYPVEDTVKIKSNDIKANDSLLTKTKDILKQIEIQTSSFLKNKEENNVVPPLETSQQDENDSNKNVSTNNSAIGSELSDEEIKRNKVKKVYEQITKANHADIKKSPDETIKQNNNIVSKSALKKNAALTKYENDLNNFIKLEIANLKTPNDDVVLGEVVYFQRLKYVSDAEYYKEFWDSMNRYLNQKGDRAINNFIEDVSDPIDSPYKGAAKELLFEGALKDDISLLKASLDFADNYSVLINSVNENLLNPLEVAIINNNYNAAYYLIMKGASVNHISKNGTSTLDIAQKKHGKDLINLLKKAGAINSDN